MNILLTGGAGYIGSHVVLALLDNGHSVSVIDDLSTGHKDLLPNNIQFLECNINNKNKVASLIKQNNFDALMHFAAFIKVEESVKILKNILLTILITQLIYLKHVLKII